MSQIPLSCVPSNPSRPAKPWDSKLHSEYEDVLITFTNKSEWYGPCDIILHQLFKHHDGFQMASQHLKVVHRGELEWTIFYLIKSGSIPVCIVEVKPYLHLKHPQKCINAYIQVENRLRSCHLSTISLVCDWSEISDYNHGCS